MSNICYLLCLLWVAMGCQYSPAGSGGTSAETLHCAGMSYLVLSSSNGIAVVNLTKDSMEVLVKKRNEMYLELTNRSFHK